MLKALEMLMDAAVGVFSPSAALARAQNRAALSAVRSFDGATSGRRGRSFGKASSNPNIDLASLPMLRARARWMYANNAYARKAVKTVSLNVVGTGIRPSFKSRTARNVARAKDGWAAWAETAECDFYGRANIYGLQAMAMRTVALSGEVLAIRRRVSRPSGSTLPPFRIQLLEGDFLDTSKNSLPVRGGESYIVQGVEHDAEGRRTAYWLFDRSPNNPNSLQIESTRVPASDVLHIFDEERPGQVRGVPFLAAPMLKLNDLEGYEDAQLMRQKIAACFSVFVTSAPNPLSMGAVQQDALERVEPGIIERLNPGEQVTFASPPGAEGYADYIRKVLQASAAGIGITYEQLTGDLSGVNFSSGRMGWLEAQRQFEEWQHNMFIPLFCVPIMGWLSDAWQSMGLVSADVTADWTPPGRAMIDPVKETKAYHDSLASGLTSWSEAVREQGYDPDALLAQIKEDARKLKDAGVPMPWLYGPNATVVPPQTEQDDSQ